MIKRSDLKYKRNKLTSFQFYPFFTDVTHSKMKMVSVLSKIDQSIDTSVTFPQKWTLTDLLRKSGREGTPAVQCSSQSVS